MSVSSLPLMACGLNRRCQLMVEVTSQILSSDDELRLCEGLRLIAATRTAVGRLSPASLESFDLHIAPRLRSILMERFGIAEHLDDLVH